jgi:hypothetical protein
MVASRVVSMVPMADARTVTTSHSAAVRGAEWRTHLAHHGRVELSSHSRRPIIRSLLYIFVNVNLSALKRPT